MVVQWSKCKGNNGACKADYIIWHAEVGSRKSHQQNFSMKSDRVGVPRCIDTGEEKVFLDSKLQAK